MEIKTFGSICSGIEAASFVFKPAGIQPVWLSEIADFQSKFLAKTHPDVPNLGDMNDIAEMIDNGTIEAPDMLCGGTPCQAFSLAGWRNGINDDRGQLTLKYIDIVNAIDRQRLAAKKNRSIFFWENVEGALTDKTNAFGCFLAGLLDLDEPISVSKWPTAGVVFGKERNIAWRVMDAKYFGVPQQRRRIYVLGGGKDFHPENILFESGDIIADPYKVEKVKVETLFDAPSAADLPLTKKVKGHHIEVFRSYSDCLYAAYGTKWNGNAAAYNGSLFIAQNGRLRRLTPLECERLMGFPDNYTLMDKCRDTQRYQAIGNSWAVPVIEWIAKRLVSNGEPIALDPSKAINYAGVEMYLLKDFDPHCGVYINTSKIPYDYQITNMVDVVDVDAAEKFYITSKGCAGILRRKTENNAKINARLEVVLNNCVD